MITENRDTTNSRPQYYA